MHVFDRMNNILDNPISTNGLIYLSNIFRFLTNVKHLSLPVITGSIAIHQQGLFYFFRNIRYLKKLEILNYRSMYVQKMYLNSQ